MRITLDIDGKRKLKKVVKKINLLFGKGFIDEIFLSSGKRGYHVISYGWEHKPIHNFIVRKILNDDIWRVRIDEYKNDFSHSGLQVLWTSKNGCKVKCVYSRFRPVCFLPKSVSSML